MTVSPLRKLLFWGPRWAIFAKVYVLLASILVVTLAVELADSQVCEDFAVTGEPDCHTTLDYGVFFAVVAAGALVVGVTSIPVFAAAILAEGLFELLSRDRHATE